MVRVPLHSHVIIAILSTGGIALSAYSLQNLPFPTWVMFKSARVLSVMIVSTFMRHIRYTILEYFGAILLTIGLITFTFGDVMASLDFNILGFLFVHYFDEIWQIWIGVVLVCLALLFDGLCGNYQEMMLHYYLPTNDEMVQSKFLENSSD